MLILRLSQPSLAAVGAELGNIPYSAVVSSLLVAWLPVSDILLQLWMGERDRLLSERGEREYLGLEQQLWKEHLGELNGLASLLKVGVAVK